MTRKNLPVWFLSCLLLALIQRVGYAGDPPRMPPPPDKVAGHGRFERDARRHMGEQLRQLLDKLKREQPEEYQRLEQLKKSDRAAYFEEIRKLMPRRPWFPGKVEKLDRQCFELSQQYRQARTQAEKDAILKELQAAVEKATDTMITDLRQRLERMGKRLEEMEKNREQLIQDRLQLLLKTKKNMPPPPPPEHDGL